jgi:hypothetical protein
MGTTRVYLCLFPTSPLFTIGPMCFVVGVLRVKRRAILGGVLLVAGLAVAPVGCNHGSAGSGSGGASGVGETGAGGAAGDGEDAGGSGGNGGAAAPGARGGSGGGEGGAGAAGSDGLGQADAAGAQETGADSVEVSAPTIAGLAIEPNPNNVLSCFVSWTTEVEANSEVQFGEGTYQYRIVTEELVTAHRVLVIGMHAQTDYLIKAVSTNSGGSVSTEGSFTSGALPSGLPIATQTVGDTSAAQPGWTLANTMPVSGRASFNGTVPGIMVMYDMQGVPVWYFVNGTTPDVRGDVSVRVLPNGNVMLGPSSGEPAKEIDLAGNVVWKGPAQPAANASTSDPATAPMSHFADKLSNGNYILFRDITNADGIGGALLQELTPSNEVAWSWNLFDHMQPPADAAKDWCHPNSVTVDLDNDVFYLSCRYQGVIKARRSGDVVWVLGGEAGGDFTFDPESAYFADQHDPEIHSDGTVLIYSNGGTALTQPPGVTSSVLEVKLDEAAMVATPTFAFPGNYSVDSWYTTSWYTPYWGDADRLANGDVLVVAGLHGQSAQTHIFEVRPSDGQIVWELTLPLGAGSYQAERISPPPLVQPM